MIVGARRGPYSCGYPVSTETRQSLYVPVMATVAFDAFSVSNLNLISIAVGNGGLPSMLKLDKIREEVAAD